MRPAKGAVEPGNQSEVEIFVPRFDAFSRDPFALDGNRSFSHGCGG